MNHYLIQWKINLSYKANNKNRFTVFIRVRSTSPLNSDWNLSPQPPGFRCLLHKKVTRISENIQQQSSLSCSYRILSIRVHMLFILLELFNSFDWCSTIGTSMCGRFEPIHAEGNEAATSHTAAGKEQNKRSATWKHEWRWLLKVAAKIKTGPTRSDYILMQIIPLGEGRCFIPYQSCHETHQPGHTADCSKRFCHYELLAFWALRPARVYWQLVQVQNHFRGCEKKKIL